MREIEFRGKRLATDSWIFGGIYLCGGAWYIRRKKDTFGMSIDPETVGQYTGLKDKNGVKIFEGDIVLRSFTESSGLVVKTRLLIAFKDGAFIIRQRDNFYHDGFAPYDTLLFKVYYLLEKLKEQDKSAESTYEVIGNIHDNADLLEGTAE